MLWYMNYMSPRRKKEKIGGGSGLQNTTIPPKIESLSSKAGPRHFKVLIITLGKCA